MIGLYLMELFKMGCMIFLSVLLIVFSVKAQYYSYANGNSGRTFRTRSCPVKCRCMALVQREQLSDSHDWKVNGLSEKTGNMPLKPTPLRGTDALCSGLGYVPWGLPTGECILPPLSCLIRGD